MSTTNKQKISKDTKIQLSINQLIQIVSTSVKNVLDQYIEQGLLGNPEVAEIQEQSQLVETFQDQFQQLLEIGSKLGMNGIPNTSRRGSSVVQENGSSPYDNSNKFDAMKYHTNFSNQASKLMNTGFGGGGNTTLTTNK